MLFAPLQVQAGFFSSFWGDEVYAQTNASNSIKVNKDLEQTSQTLALLQSNISPALVLQDKNNKGKDSQVDESADVNIVSDNALLPATGPLGVHGNKVFVDSSTEVTSVYVVRKGDSISAIASMFGVSVNTILIANDLKKRDKLSEGDVLFILPISGLEHIVTQRQTLQSIAKTYKVDVNDVAFYNGIAEDAKLAVGYKLFIPDGEMYDEGGDKPAPNLGSAVARDAKYYETRPFLQDLKDYFLNPVPTGRKTQGLHGPGNRGIDIGAPTGTSIYASAAGTVIFAKTGCAVGKRRCGGGYGNMVVVEHPNGTKTLYAHMSTVIARIGDEVAQGKKIGTVGNTGRSTGPHIHFEVFNARNPGVDWSWAN